MNGADIAALATAIPAILGAITALIVATRARGAAAEAKGLAGNASDRIIKHLTSEAHTDWSPKSPLPMSTKQPPTNDNG